MRRSPPLILGAGPAGCAAALALEAHGVHARVIERTTTTGDAICGGFMSWRTLESLGRLGITPERLGGHPVARVTLFTQRAQAEARLPAAAIGLSRYALDTVLQSEIVARGLAFERGRTVRGVAPGQARIDDETVEADDIFLASGKHDVRGSSRPRDSDDPTLGLRLRIPPHPGLTALIGDAIELHLSRGSYVGLVLQEDGSANLCLAVRKSRLGESGGDPRALLTDLARGNRLADRLAFADQRMVDAIAAVPYGWRAKTTEPGVWRLGDQAAVIPSLAGEGIGIAIASGLSAAQGFVRGDTAPRWQHRFAAASRRPVTVARLLWKGAETPALATLALPLLARVPALASLMARATRIGD